MSRIAALAALIIATLQLSAQKPAPHLEIRTETGQTTFHIGERIPLVLSFTGPDGTEIPTYNFGRTDPLRLDSFAITPTTGWTDSLVAYAVFLSGGCCGARKVGKLSAKPITLEMNLNEWARFDEPGTYTLTITTHRLSKRLFGPLESDRNNLPSNPLELHIIAATPKWQKATLDRILHDIAIPYEPYSEESPQRLAALADLRYLGSPAAITALASSIRDEQYDLSNEAFLGLIGLPRNLRENALAALNKLIDDPTFPISQQFLEVIPWLQMDDPKLPTAETLEAMQAAYSAHQATMQPLLDAAWETTAAQLSRKQGAARTITAQTLAAMVPLHPSAAAAEEVGSSLRASFPNLSAADKASLLSDHWNLLRSRSLLPQLRAIGQAPAEDSNAMPFGFPEMKSLRAIALARWYELEPDNALIEIRHQIAQTNPDLSAGDLDFLHDQTFPEFERLWAQGFAKAKNTNDYQTVASLLMQFGTGSASPQIAPLVTQPGPDYSCGRPSEALAYLVKFSPDTARHFLQHPSGSPTAQGYDCSVAQISFIGAYVQNPILLDAAVQTLKSQDAFIVQDALTYLRRFGDESVRQPILDRYLQWSEYQSAHPTTSTEDDLPKRDDPTYAAARKLRDDRELGDDLARALLANQGWIPDTALVDTVRQHCTVQQTCENIKWFTYPVLAVSATPPHDQYSLHIGPFEPATMELFEAKIDQFPKGTVFTFGHTITGGQAAQNAFEATLPDLFAKHGMVLK
jgi:hypothetical protein